MLKLINVSKSILSRKVLQDINLCFNSSGFYVITGPSGCGKTTLLNILAKYDKNYQGLILYKGLQSGYDNCSIAYMTQKSILLNDETSISNLEISCFLDTLAYTKSNLSKQINNININGTNYVKYLSGGQKQKVAFLSQFIKKANVILCDEITSGLDENNAITIVKRLKELSKHRLVIMVTHNINVVEGFYDAMYKMMDGKIVEKIVNPSKNSNLFIRKISKKKKHLNFRLLFRIVLNKIRTKFHRTSICISMLSIGFTCFTLSTLITSSIKQNVLNAFNSILKSDELVFRPKIANKKENLVPVSKDIYNDILNKYPEYFDNLCVKYTTNIDSALEKSDCVLLLDKKKVTLPSFSLNCVNDFVLENDLSLDNDQIVLTLTKSTLTLVRLFLDIKSDDLQIINNFIKGINLSLSFYVSNSKWDYKDQISFRIMSINEGEKDYIIHSNPLFNQYIYEDLMRFKDIDNLINYVPWALEKQTYLHSLNVSRFLNDSFFIDEFKKYIPSKYNDFGIVFFDFSGKSINENDIKKYLSHDYIYDIKFNTLNSYCVINDTMISGFANDFLLTSDENKLEEVIEANSRLKKNETSVYPDDIALGNATNLKSNNVTFSSYFSKEIALKTNEVYVSKSLFFHLFKKDFSSVQKAKIAYLNRVSYDENSRINTYTCADIYIKGVLESEGYCVFQRPKWLITYFRDYLNVPNEELIVKSVQFKCKDKYKSNLLRENSNNNDFEIIDDSQNVSSIITNTIDITQAILKILSYCTLSLSLIMIILVAYLFNKENINDFVAIYVLGGGKKDVRNYKIVYLFVIVFSSFLLTCLSMIFIYLLLKISNISFIEIGIKEVMNAFKTTLKLLFGICVLLLILNGTFLKTSEKIDKLIKDYK